MKKRILILAVIVASVLFSACGGEDTPTATPSTKPAAVTLVAPSNGAVCVDGKFEWNASKDATSYTLTLFNNDGSVYNTSTTTETTKTISDLPKSKAITWQVIAKNTAGETMSSKWSASTPGEAIVNYIPTITVTIDIINDSAKIVASDADGDTLTYDFYISTDNVFTDSERYITNQAIAINQTEIISNVGFLMGEELWMMSTIKDSNGNESTTIKSYDGK